RLRISRNGEIDFREALEILVVRFHKNMSSTDADELGTGSNDSVVIALDVVMEGMGRAPEILDLEANDDIGLPDHRARAFALVERMPRREIHTAAKIDPGALQDAGEFNEPINTGLGASAAISNDHWIGRANQELGGFRNRAWIANQRGDSWTLGNDELL